MLTLGLSLSGTTASAQMERYGAGGGWTHSDQIALGWIEGDAQKEMIYSKGLLSEPDVVSAQVLTCCNDHPEPFVRVSIDTPNMELPIAQKHRA
ncbi:hypothetical protein AB0T83_17140 [Fluviibacterium sp. DFM31]|uniref:Uncharacterized protein n=1 Tax=Meridianimarinicoccus marinus TaxID=3231483 RepID=A0ABV3LAB1_9RHOB